MTHLPITLPPMSNMSVICKDEQFDFVHSNDLTWVQARQVFQFIKEREEYWMANGTENDVVISADGTGYWTVDENVHMLAIFDSEGDVAGYMSFTDARNTPSGDVLLDCIEVHPVYYGYGLAKHALTILNFVLDSIGSSASVFHDPNKVNLDKLYDAYGYEAQAVLPHCYGYGTYMKYRKRTPVPTREPFLTYLRRVSA